MRITLKETILPGFCFKEKNKNLIFYNLAKNYIKKMISIGSIIQRSNDVDKIKAFLFDENTINVFENLKNPPLKNLKEDTKTIWTETIFEEEDLSAENYERKIKLISRKQNKIFIEDNIDKIVSIINA